MLNRSSILNQPNKISHFEDVFRLQKKYQYNLIKSPANNQYVWIGQHDLCYTLGKGGNSKNILAGFDKKKYSLLTIDRGGEVTCHMPGQLVVYLILDLNNYKKDLDWYLRKLEEVIIKVLKKLNIVSSTKRGLTGVWCNDKKIASIGIGCKRWVTIHGFSLNVNCDLENFNKIIPCGIEGCKMTKIADIKRDIKIIEVKDIVKNIVQKEFNLDFVSE